MKSILILFTILIASNLNAETLTCTGRSNNSNMSPLDFEIQIIGKPDKDFPTQIQYKSIIQYTMPDGSNLSNSIDLNENPRTQINKIIYRGQNATLELSFSSTGELRSSILNSPLNGFNQLTVSCTIQGEMLKRPVCNQVQDLNKLLNHAVRSGNIDLIETAIECGADVNKADPNFCTPLMAAIEPSCGISGGSKYISSINSPLATIDTLLNNGAFTNIVDKNNESALIKAAKLQINDVYNSFIASEADFDIQDKDGNTALMHAAANGNTSVIEQILEGNPDRRIKNKIGQTAFDIAKIRQHQSVIDLVQIPDLIITLQGQSDGTCSPLKIDLQENQVVELVLQATSNKMFMFKSQDLNLNLMADSGKNAKLIFTAASLGSFKFTCGFHGSNSATPGEIVVKRKI